MAPGKILAFLALSHGWTWSLWALAASLGDSIWTWPAAPLFYAGGAGVALGGLVMTRLSYGRDGLRELGRSVVHPGRVSPGQWCLILVFYPLLALAAAGAMKVVAGGEAFDPGGAATRLANPAQLAAMVGFTLLLGPLPEELGWRGYLQRVLQERWSGVAAALLVGVIWWSWHLPLLLLPGYYDAFERSAPGAIDLLINIIPAAVLYAWVYNATGRSVLAVIVFHFMENFTSEFLGLSDDARPYRLVLMGLLAFVAMAKWPQADSHERRGL